MIPQTGQFYLLRYYLNIFNQKAAVRKLREDYLEEKKKAIQAKDDVIQKLEKKETLNQKLDKILEEIKLLGISLPDEEAKEQLRSIYKKVYNLKK